MNRSAALLCSLALCSWAPTAGAQTKQDAGLGVDQATLAAVCGEVTTTKSGCTKCPIGLKGGKGPLRAGVPQEFDHAGTKLRAVELTGCSEAPSTAFFATEDGKPVLLGTVSGACRAIGKSIFCGEVPNAQRLMLDTKAKKVSLTPKGDSAGPEKGFGGLGLKGAGRGGGGIGERGIGLANIGTAGRGPKKQKPHGHDHDAPVPKVVPGKPKVDGSLDKEIVRRVVRQNRREIKFCYENELRKQPKLKGRVLVQFTISATGAVVGSKLVETDLNSKNVERCIVGKIARWKFPKPKEGIVKVEYPFYLNY